MTAKTKIRSIAAIDPEARADKGYEFEIMTPAFDENDRPKKDKDGKPVLEGTGQYLTVVGKESSTFKALMRSVANEARRALIDKKEPEFRPIEDDIEREIETLATCTIAWRNVVIDEAEGVLEFTPDNVRRLYRYDFVRRQADQAVMAQSDFTQG